MPGCCAGHYERCGYGLETGLIVPIVLAVFVHHVIHGAAIPFTEAFAEVLASFSLDTRVLVYFMIIGIGMAMLAEITPCSLNALVITALLCLAVAIRWRVPTVVVLVLCSTGNRLCFMRSGFECAG